MGHALIFIQCSNNQHCNRTVRVAFNDSKLIADMITDRQLIISLQNKDCQNVMFYDFKAVFSYCAVDCL